MQTKLEQVPAEALRLTSGPFQFADGNGDGSPIPIEMLARTGDAISHWYWGNVVHDLDGMSPTKQQIPIDYLHDPQQMMGYLNEFDTSSGDLITRGALVPFQSGDRVDEVTTKARAGVPYEASIDFTGEGIEIEQYDAGAEVTVNGRQFEGPLTVIRQWPLRAVSVVPYGADMNTSTALSSAETYTVTLKKDEKPMSLSEFLTDAAGEDVKGSVAQWCKESGLDELDALALVFGMPLDTSQQKEAGRFVIASGIDAGWEWPDNVKFTEPAKPAISGQGREDAKRYSDAFGDIGLRCWAEGKTFEDAGKAFAEDYQKRLESAEEEVVKLRAENDALKLAGSDPVELGDDPDGGDRVSFKERMQKRVDDLNSQD